MKKINRKGFTLVELLAVIVILALIMSIAIYSISGILQTSRENTFKETALNIISGVRMQLLAANELKAGEYYFKEGLLENNNELPFGGKIHYHEDGANVDGTSLVTRGSSSSTCDPSKGSFVTVTEIGGSYSYSICLTSDDTTSSSAKYINGSETDLLGKTVDTIHNVNSSSSED